MQHAMQFFKSHLKSRYHRGFSQTSRQCRQDCDGHGPMNAPALLHMTCNSMMFTCLHSQDTWPITLPMLSSDLHEHTDNLAQTSMKVSLR